MLTYNACGVGTVEAENGSPAESLLSGEGELPEEADDSPGTSRDTEEEAMLSDDFYSHDTDEEDDQSKRKRERVSAVSKIPFSFFLLNYGMRFSKIFKFIHIMTINQNKKSFKINRF